MGRHGNLSEVRGRPLRLTGGILTPSDNLLDGLPWIQGTGTIMTIASGRVRILYDGGNPRTYKTVTGLTIGRTYHIRGNVYVGNGEQNMFFRVSETANLPDGNIYNGAYLVDAFIDDTFIAPATTLHLGLVAIRTPGQYAEIEQAFKLSLT